MDATRRRRTKDEARQRWYSRWRSARFARLLGFAAAPVVRRGERARPPISPLT